MERRTNEPPQAIGARRPHLPVPPGSERGGALSAYEDALKRVFFDYPDDPEFLQMVVDAFLAALPPSIVVDGRVVELEEVENRLAHRVMVGSWGSEPDGSGGFGSPPDIASWLIDAAREVADAPSS